jgi:hypothetical protein
MKKVLFFLVAVCLVLSSFAASLLTSPSPKKATEIMIPVGTSGKQISLMELSEIKVKDFEQLSGHKMKLIDKFGFHLAQRDLRKSINEDGTINNKRLEKFTKRFAGDTGFHLGGFALGFLLGLLGVLIAYLIKDEYKPNRVKWAWIGLAGLVALSLIIALL